MIVLVVASVVGIHDALGSTSALTDAFDDGGEIVLRGTISYDIRPHVPERRTRRTDMFRVRIRGDNTLIHTASEDGVKYREAAFDGETVYRVLNAPVDGAERVAAEVSYFTVPPDDGSLINYLWLAYGSGRYFDTRGTNRLHPVWLLEDARLAHSGFTVEAWWERSPGERVPRKIIYLSDGYARTPQRTWKWPPPFDQGFTNAVYEVTVHTNFHHRLLPLAFRFVRYGVTQWGVEPVTPNGLGLGIITAVEARVSEVEVRKADGPLRPNFKGVASVTDYRFEKSNPPLPLLDYRATNAHWPAMDGHGDNTPLARYEQEVRLRERLEKMRQQQAPQAISVRRTVIRMAVGLTTCVLLFWVYRISRREQRG